MQALDRILDANLNRAREGLRVAEELARLVLEDAGLQRRIKAIRHDITRLELTIPALRRFHSRAVDRDPGSKFTSRGERSRTDLTGVARANLRRSEEALRVLEEISKLTLAQASATFKHLRFKTYDVERDLILQLENQPLGRAGSNAAAARPRTGKTGRTTTRTGRSGRTT